MLRTKVFTIDNPLLYDYSEVDLSEATLSEIRFTDDNGNIVRQEIFDQDGTLESVEESVFRSDDKPISFSLYMGVKKELFRRIVFDYTENGHLKSERHYVDGQLTREEINFYDAKDQIERNTLKEEGKSAVVTLYRYHPEFFECCIREEILKENVIDVIITREWELYNGKPVLVHEQSETLSNPEALRVKKFYEVGNGERGIESELYNDRGDFLEETRITVNDRGLIERRDKHADDLLDSIPYAEEIYEYDEKDRTVLVQRSSYGIIHCLEKFWYDEKDRLVKEMIKASNQTTFTFFVHKEVDDISTS